MDERQREVEAVRLPSWGRLVPSEGTVPWVVVDDAGRVVEPVAVFLRDLAARGRSSSSIRSYGLALLRWWRFLIAIDERWDRATSVEVRDFVLWLRQATKPITEKRVGSRATAGGVNTTTRKSYPGDGYAPSTIRHSNAVLRAFYDFRLDCGGGPLINPVVVERSRGTRAHAHHNPLTPFRAEGRLRYNPRPPKRQPRAIPDALWDGLFAAMRCHRDRAVLATAISCGARAGELLGMRGVDVDWGEQLIRVVRKGTRAEQWLPVSADALVWLRLYIDDIGGIVAADDMLWRTMNRRGGVHVPLSYDSLRAVFRRANRRLSTNWTMHDLRHTCAIRMVRDGRLTVRDVQTILGHAHLSTTQLYLEQDNEEVFARVREHHARLDAARVQPPPPVARGYNAADLTLLFGGAL